MTPLWSYGIFLGFGYYEFEMRDINLSVCIKHILICVWKKMYKCLLGLDGMSEMTTEFSLIRYAQLTLLNANYVCIRNKLHNCSWNRSERENIRRAWEKGECWSSQVISAVVLNALWQWVCRHKQTLKGEIQQLFCYPASRVSGNERKRTLSLCVSACLSGGLALLGRMGMSRDSDQCWNMLRGSTLPGPESIKQHAC